SQGHGLNYTIDGSNDAVVKDFKTSDQNLPSGTYGITITKDILSSYKTQKSFNATIVTSHTNMSTDSLGNNISTDSYDANSKVIT
ncbi:hypothetical protein, partial [Campylobacter jejuni]|uniref:hypothetical protein n=1 Tax=Campylobacter jejuni TaxID=197 RepID=UPI0028F2842F